MNMYALLIAAPVRGFLWTALLFSFCFFGIHLFKLAHIGWDKLSEQAKPAEKEKKKEEKKTPATPQEPIYYIVERKTRRAKSSYSEPKEIRFK